MIFTMPELYDTAGVQVEVGEFKFDDEDECLLEFNYTVIEIPFYPHESFEDQLRTDLGLFVMAALEAAVVRAEWLTND